MTWSVHISLEIFLRRFRMLCSSLPWAHVFVHLQINELVNNANNCTNLSSDNLGCAEAYILTSQGPRFPLTVWNPVF